MFLLNLSLPEFLALFSALSGLTVALYLLSRSRRRQMVPTLRFWAHAKQPVPSARRKRIQQPWSLVLQLLSLACLLLAIAQLKLGDRERGSRDHVLLLDASSWMGARNGDRPLMDEARARAHSWIRSLPGSDRVMVVRVDGLPSPVTGMEADRAILTRVIDETRPGASALNLEQAFSFAEQVRKLHGSSGGEIVYVGAGRTSGTGLPSAQPANMRLLEVKSPADNYGFSRIGVRRSDTNPEAWEIFVAVRNGTKTPRRLPVAVAFGGAPVGSTMLDVPAGAVANHTFQLRTRARGWIEARLMVRDALSDDNRAILELPELKSLKVAVFTDDPESIRPVLAAHPQVQASYHPPAQYRADVDAHIVIFDRFAPPAPPKSPAVWIEPPGNSPFRTKTTISEASQVSWRADHEICSGIRTRDLRLTAGQVLATSDGDVPFATTSAGPVAVVRPEKRMVALGFHPGRSDMKFDLATPLLMANILRWLEPDVFRATEVHGGSVGAVTMALQAGTDPAKVRVTADGQDLPFTIQSDTLRFYAGVPGVVRVQAGPREQVHSLSLPEVAEKTWEPATTVRRGMPGLVEQALSRDLWQILAILGGIGLAVDWLLFGRRGLPRFAGPQTATPSAAAAGAWRKAS